MVQLSVRRVGRQVGALTLWCAKNTNYIKTFHVRGNRSLGGPTALESRPTRSASIRGGAAAVARTCVGANSLCNWHGKCFTSDNAHKYSPLNIITCNWLTTGQSFIYSSNNYWEHFAQRNVHARSCPDKNGALESTSVALEP